MYVIVDGVCGDDLMVVVDDFGGWFDDEILMYICYDVGIVGFFDFDDVVIVNFDVGFDDFLVVDDYCIGDYGVGGIVGLVCMVLVYGFV